MLAAEVVVIEPWSPWPLIFPAILAVIGILASAVGTRFQSEPMRETGFVAFLLGVLAILAMTWSLAGIWDSRHAPTPSSHSATRLRPSAAA